MRRDCSAQIGSVGKRAIGALAGLTLSQLLPMIMTDSLRRGYFSMFISPNFIPTSHATTV